MSRPVDDFPRVLWLFLPLTGMLVQGLLEIFLPQETLARLHTEFGPHEILQFLIVGAAFFAAMDLFFKIRSEHPFWLKLWAGLAALSCFYVAGEEVSWGQHVMQWSTPEYWQAINDQGETNLHNTSSWLDQKPRLILELGVLAGGLIIPLLLRFKPHLLLQKFALIYPTAQFMPMTILVLAVTIIDKVDKVLPNIKVFERASEVEELYLFYFVLLYLVLLKRRVLQQQN